MERLVYHEGYVLISLIRVGEIAGAKMSDFKGLEEVRETPIKRQGEGNADNGGDCTCRGRGLGEISLSSAPFSCELKLLLKNKVYKYK